jgi:prepilin-type N-terminal cleavage/methylation domain-containing protein/prepilin-type processing-associated H-X9-DG protein
MFTGRKAFTLIELLVVIAVIALLLSVIVPALQKAKEKTRELACRNNLRQLCMGLTFYAEDNGGYAMELMDVFGNYWFHEIAPYLGDRFYEENPEQGLEGVMDIAYCPSTKPLNPEQSGLGTAKIAWRFLEGEGSYGMNLWLCNYGTYSEGLPNEKYFEKVTNAGADVPAFADCVWVGGWPFGADLVPTDLTGEVGYGSGYPHGEGYFMGRFCIDRHNMAVNVSFIDGHADKVRLEELWTIRWNRRFEPNYDVEVTH